MSKNKTFKQKDLGWFNLSNYEQYTTQHSWEVIQQLLLRSLLINTFPLDQSNSSNLHADLLNQIWDDIKQTGRYNKVSTTPFIPNCGGAYVRPLTIGDSVALSELINTVLDTCDPAADFDTDLFEISESNRFVCLHIDLFGADHQIEDEFKSIIAYYRRAKGVKAQIDRISNPLLKKILEYKAIPYLDLKIWELQTNSSISNSRIAELLFPYEEKTEYHIRTTTKKYADEAINEHNLIQLASSAKASKYTT